MVGFRTPHVSVWEGISEAVRTPNLRRRQSSKRLARAWGALRPKLARPRDSGRRQDREHLTIAQNPQLNTATKYTFPKLPLQCFWGGDCPAVVTAPGRGRRKTTTSPPTTSPCTQMQGQLCPCANLFGLGCHPPASRLLASQSLNGRSRGRFPRDQSLGAWRSGSPAALRSVAKGFLTRPAVELLAPSGPSLGA